jgi:hypothetical protein
VHFWVWVEKMVSAILAISMISILTCLSQQYITCTWAIHYMYMSNTLHST